MLIDIQLGQCTDIDLEFIFFWQIMGQRIIQTMNAFDHQNILLTKLHIMSVIFPFSGLEIERRKLNPFSCKQLFQIVIKKFHIQCFQTLIIRLSFCVQRSVSAPILPTPGLMQTTAAVFVGTREPVSSSLSVGNMTVALRRLPVIHQWL